MNHIGIDLGSRESQVCVRNSAGEVIEEGRRPTRELAAWLATRAPARVILETCTEAFRLAGLARQHGHEVRVVAATLVRALEVGQRGLKNDVRDARTLSEASCRIGLPSVHIPTVASQEVKAICFARSARPDANGACATVGSRVGAVVFRRAHLFPSLSVDGASLATPSLRLRACKSVGCYLSSMDEAPLWRWANG
jgi:hypothetical protein